MFRRSRFKILDAFFLLHTLQKVQNGPLSCQNQKVIQWSDFVAKITGGDQLWSSLPLVSTENFVLLAFIYVNFFRLSLLVCSFLVFVVILLLPPSVQKKVSKILYYFLGVVGRLDPFCFCWQNEVVFVLSIAVICRLAPLPHFEARLISQYSLKPSRASSPRRRRRIYRTKESFMSLGRFPSHVSNLSPKLVCSLRPYGVKVWNVDFLRRCWRYSFSHILSVRKGHFCITSVDYIFSPPTLVRKIWNHYLGYGPTARNSVVLGRGGKCTPNSNIFAGATCSSQGFLFFCSFFSHFIFFHRFTSHCTTNTEGGTKKNKPDLGWGPTPVQHVRAIIKAFYVVWKREGEGREGGFIDCN